MPADLSPRAALRWSRSHWYVPALAGLLAAVYFTIAAPSGGTRTGPLDAGTVSTESGGLVDVGHVETWGGLFLYNHTDDPIVLDRARLLDPDNGSAPRVSDVRVLANLAQTGFVFSDSHFPPQQRPKGSEFHLVPVRGYVVPPDPNGTDRPDRAVELLFAVSAPGRGRYRNDSVQVDYRIGDEHFRKQFQQHVLLCAPKAAWTPERCSDSAG